MQLFMHVLKIAKFRVRLDGTPTYTVRVIIASLDAEVNPQLYFILEFPAWIYKLLRNCVVWKSKWLFCVRLHPPGNKNNGIAAELHCFVHKSSVQT